MTIILQAHGIYELSILKTHGNHLIKTHGKVMIIYLRPMTFIYFISNYKLMFTIYLTLQHS